MFDVFLAALPTHEKRVTALDERLAGALPDHYAIERQLGVGGMATVYLAEDRKHHRSVAVKVLHPEFSHLLGRTRFLREIEIASHLTHPGIVPLFDSGLSDNVAYYVMPYVEGESLRDRLARERQLPLEDALRITREVGDALAFAHGHGIVHRDIKPGNILLGAGHAMLADFGIARAITEAGGEEITSSGLAVGTPPYMSPEQANGRDPVDARSDVYGLACVVYEMLAGQPPFVAVTAQAVLAMHQAERPPSLEIVRPGVGHAVQGVIEKALAKAPADRWQSVTAFVAALEHAAVAPNSAEYLPAPLAVPQPVPWWRRWDAVAGTAAVLVAAGVVAVWRPWAPAVVLDPNRVMGFPLRTQGTATRADAELVMQAIENAMIHTEPLKWLDSWGIADPADRDAPARVAPATVRRLALQHGARFYVTGVVTQVNDSQAVALDLYDAKGDSFVVREVASGTDPAALLGMRAVNALLPRLVGRSTHVDEAWLRPRRPAAVVSWLQGEVAYRHARYPDAMAFYRRALEEDSTLVVAALKAAMTATWIKSYALGDTLVRFALAHVDQLPVRNARLARGLRFFIAGDADSAAAWLRRALDADPDWSEAWYALGDVYLHLMPSGTRLDSVAEADFARSVQLDREFAPALFHLAELTLRRGDVRAGHRLVEEYARLATDSARVAYFSTMERCVGGGAESVAWDEVARRYPEEVVGLGRWLAAGLAWPRCARAAFAAVLRSGAVPMRWVAVEGMHHYFLARGAPDSALGFVDSLLASGYRAAEGLLVLDATVGLGTDTRAAASLHQFQRRVDSLPPSLLAFFAPFFVHQGDVARIDSARQAYEALASGAPAFAAAAGALAARLALARGDTARAIDLLERARAVALPGQMAWGIWEPMGAERLLLAQLLLARGRAREALDVAGEFDRALLVNLVYLRPSLEVRARAAEALGEGRSARTYRQRLIAAGAGGGH